ncbi:MAG TPA: hypothetical protein VFX27_06005 [Sphingobium sp.]|nr:hypothetical protein [Sphingobium sp.]
MAPLITHGIWFAKRQIAVREAERKRVRYRRRARAGSRDVVTGKMRAERPYAFSSVH